MAGFVYLASPYSHPDAAVRQQRFEAAIKVVAMLMNRHEFVLSPVVHNHPVAEQESLPGSWDFWEPYCTAFLRTADKLLVLKLDGWDVSSGVLAEIEIAHQLNLPVEYMEA